MDPEEFHETAEFLSKSSPSEAHIRTSINRAYYGTFLYFREYLKGKGITKRIHPRKEVHVFVRDLFEWSQSTIGRKLAQVLLDLTQRRHDADYDLTKTHRPSDSEDALVIARNAITEYGTITPDEETELLKNANDRAARKGWI